MLPFQDHIQLSAKPPHPAEFQVRFWQFECRSKNEQSESKIRIHSVQLHLQPPNDMSCKWY